MSEYVPPGNSALRPHLLFRITLCLQRSLVASPGGLDETYFMAVDTVLGLLHLKFSEVALLFLSPDFGRRACGLLVKPLGNCDSRWFIVPNTGS
jgi:hypothetical protein